MSMIEDGELHSKIVEALADATNTAVRELMAGKAEEESITSRIGARLEKALAELGLSHVRITTWDVPKKAVEPYLGADIYIGIEVSGTSPPKRKGIFVQAKRAKIQSREKLRDQCEKMQIITKKGSAVWVYEDDGIAAASTDHFLKGGSVNISANEFFDEILSCRLGDMKKAPAQIFGSSAELGKWVRKFGTSQALSVSA